MRPLKAFLYTEESRWAGNLRHERDPWKVPRTGRTRRGRRRVRSAGRHPLELEQVELGDRAPVADEARGARSQDEERGRERCNMRNMAFSFSLAWRRGYHDRPCPSTKCSFRLRSTTNSAAPTRGGKDSRAEFFLLIVVGHSTSSFENS